MEVVIGIAILALIVFPLLGVFASSSRLSSDSFEIGNATLIGENINEQLLVTDFEQWWEDGVTPTLSGGLVGRFVEPDGSGGYTDIAAGTAPSAPYYIAFDNVTSSNSVFNVVLTLDPDGEYGATNQTPISQHTPMDYAGVQDRLPGRDPDQISWTDFLKEAATYGYDTSTFVRDDIVSTRAIDIIITNDGAAAHATVQHAYVYNFPPATGDVDPAAPTTFQWEGTDTILPITPRGEGAPLPAAGEEQLAFFYLFYPWYHEGGDLIRVQNVNSLPCTLVLSKMVDNTNPNLEAAERAYVGGAVQITQPGGGDNAITLLDNLQSSLHPSVADHTGKVSYTYNSIPFTGSNSLVLQEQEDRLYSVNIQMFERIVPGGLSDYAEGSVHSVDTTVLK